MASSKDKEARAVPAAAADGTVEDETDSENLFTLSARGKIMGVFFSTGVVPNNDPSINCQKALTDLIAKAKHKIHIAIFMFTDRTIADALIAAHARGVEVRIVCDQMEAATTSMKIELDRLVQNGIDVKITTKQKALMHNKMMVVDDRYVATGSYNWTLRAQKNNDENLVIIDGKEVASSFETFVFERVLNYETLRGHNPAAAAMPDETAKHEEIRQLAIELAPYYGAGPEFNDDPDAPRHQAVAAGTNPQPNGTNPDIEGQPVDALGNALPLYPPVNNPDAPSQQDL